MHLVVSAGRALALLCLCACASSAPEVEVAAPRKAAPKDPDALVLEVVVDEGSSEAERSRALLLERVERSSKLSSSPADGTRRLKVRLSIAEPSVCLPSPVRICSDTPGPPVPVGSWAATAPVSSGSRLGETMLGPFGGEVGASD